MRMNSEQELQGDLIRDICAANGYREDRFNELIAELNKRQWELEADRGKKCLVFTFAYEYESQTLEQWLQGSDVTALEAMLRDWQRDETETE